LKKVAFRGNRRVELFPKGGSAIMKLKLHKRLPSYSAEKILEPLKSHHVNKKSYNNFGLKVRA